MTTPITEVTNPNQGFESTEYAKKNPSTTFYGEAEDASLKTSLGKTAPKQLSDAQAQAVLDTALGSSEAVGTAKKAYNKQVATPATSEEIEEARKNGTLKEGQSDVQARQIARPATKEEIEEARKNGTLKEGQSDVQAKKIARPATKEEIEEARKNGTLKEGQSDAKATMEGGEKDIARPATKQQIADALKSGNWGQDSAAAFNQAAGTGKDRPHATLRGQARAATAEEIEQATKDGTIKDGSAANQAIGTLLQKDEPSNYMVHRPENPNQFDHNDTFVHDRPKEMNEPQGGIDNSDRMLHKDRPSHPPIKVSGPHDHLGEPLPEPNW